MKELLKEQLKDIEIHWLKLLGAFVVDLCWGLFAGNRS